MADSVDKAAHFLELHHQERPLLLANAWDVGSARLLRSIGFQALASTSSGYAASLGRLDYAVDRGEALTHAAALVDATELPVSADFEDGFAKDASGVAETVRLGSEIGLAGCSIEDWSSAEERLYDLEEAAERVAAAAEAAHGGATRVVLTARAENHIRGNPDLDDTIARLRAFQEAGADVLYAPGIVGVEDIVKIVAAVNLPVNVLARPGLPAVDELSSLGVKRVSVGGAFAFAALAASAEAASEFFSCGTYDFLQQSAAGVKVAHDAFALRPRG
jgi:2-methylisocitrate lyase-like PEP mutase family enzyme